MTYTHAKRPAPSLSRASTLAPSPSARRTRRSSPSSSTRARATSSCPPSPAAARLAACTRSTTRGPPRTRWRSTPTAPRSETPAGPTSDVCVWMCAAVSVCTTRFAERAASRVPCPRCVCSHGCDAGNGGAVCACPGGARCGAVVAPPVEGRLPHGGRSRVRAHPARPPL